MRPAREVYLSRPSYVVRDSLNNCYAIKLRSLSTLISLQIFREPSDLQICKSARMKVDDFIADEMRIYQRHFETRSNYRKLIMLAYSRVHQLRTMMKRSNATLEDTPLTRFFVRLFIHGEVSIKIMRLIAELKLYDPKKLAFYYLNPELLLDTVKKSRTEERIAIHHAAKQLLEITPLIVDLFKSYDMYREWCDQFAVSSASYRQSQTYAHTRETYQEPESTRVLEPVPKPVPEPQAPRSEEPHPDLPQLIQGFKGNS